MQKNSALVQLVCIISITHIASLFGSDEILGSTANEAAFEKALINVAINPSESNLITLKKNNYPSNNKG